MLRLRINNYIKTATIVKFKIIIQLEIIVPFSS